MKPRHAALAIGLLAAFARADDDAYTRIVSAYAPYLDANDPQGLPLKIRSLAGDEYKFWRGSKDLFFQWAKPHCADWLADPKTFLPNHGDLHLGNIGTYVTEDGFTSLGFGMVDFDDSAKLPFQLELLQGLITLELVARQNQIALTPEQHAQLDTKLLDSYRIAVNSRRHARDLLQGDSLVEKMIAKALKKQHADDLEKFTSEGVFRTVVKKKDKITDLLDPVDVPRYDAFAATIAQAIASDERLAKLMPDASTKSVRKLIRQVVRRTRIDSSGSQGLHKYLVLLDRPFKGIDHDVVLYLKQEIPTAAERAGVAPRDPRSPGQRCAEDMDRMTAPRAFICSWADLEGKSFWVHFKEPFSDEIDFGAVKDFDELLHMAHVWSTVVGATHREDGRFEQILPKLTPALQQQLRDRAAAYLEHQRQSFANFQKDSRVLSCIATVEKILTGHAAK